MDVIDVPSVDFSKVLLASDFSEESERALAYAKAIVRASGGELLLVHVAQLGPVLPLPEGSWIGDNTARIKAEERQTEEAAAELRAQGLKVRAFCPSGTVGQKVAQMADVCHANLVVVGTHGRRGLNRLLFGSGAEETAGCVETPLLIIGPMAPIAAHARWRPTRILCATTLATEEARLVAYACLLAKKSDASLEIVSFKADSKGGGNSRWFSFRNCVAKLLSSQDAKSLPLQTLKLPEPRAKSLIEGVIARGSDLLVIGAESQDWLTLHQGTVQELLSELPCPILTFSIP
jgi:nucleotide-binding universal stress UspA family protein